MYRVNFKIFTDHRRLKYLFDQKELNIRQRVGMELLKYYDCEIHYHLEKANIVADVLSRKEKPIKISSAIMGIVSKLPELNKER